MKEADTLLADQVLQRVRGALVPTQADAARNLAGIEARLGLAGSGIPPARADVSPGPSGPGLDAAASVANRIGANAPLVAARGLRLSAQLGVLVSFGVATGVVGYLLGRGAAEPRPAASPVALMQPAAPPAALPAIVPAPGTSGEASPDLASPAAAIAGEGMRSAERLAANVPAAAPQRRPAARAVSHRSSSASIPKSNALELSEALELLRRAESAVRHSDGLEARMWLGDLDRRAPREMLREERLTTWVLAACALGELAAAREALAELERSNPESMYRARLEGSCVTATPLP